MNKLSTIYILLVCIANIAAAQSANDILGKWQSAHGNGQIEIYKRGDLYYGKIVWLNQPNDETGKPKRDVNNPSKNLTSRPILGLEILRDFIYKDKGIWANGEIYDPKTGNTYNCQMTINNGNKLNIRAFFGLNILGKTETWTRIEAR
ncbi:MAG: DUF2147 domain-containing protein [Sphingobacteriaceae bacterium]|nr:DUF2147 domain-containing protein [Sphingobacteriaceae bacterium]